MLVSKFLNKAIAAAEAEVIRVVGSVDSLLFTLQNQDSSNTMVYKLQESDDGQTWTDLELPLTGGGTASQFSILAGEVHTVRMSSSKPRTRVMASGDLMAGIGLNYSVTTSTDDTPVQIFPT